MARPPRGVAPGVGVSEPVWPDLRARAVLVEEMDRAECDPVLLLRTIDQFRHVNRWFSRGRDVLRRHVLDVMEREPGRSYRLADLGAGGCDLGRWLLRAARARGLRLEIVAVDSHPLIAAHAEKLLCGERGIRVCCAPVEAVLARESFDFTFAQHFLHHLPDAAIPDLLRAAARASAVGVVVNDLRRSRFSYNAFGLLAGLCWRGSYIRVDGLRSIRRGFLPGELAAHAAAAGWSAVRVERRMPGRLTLVGGRPGA